MEQMLCSIGAYAWMYDEERLTGCHRPCARQLLSACHRFSESWTTTRRAYVHQRLIRHADVGTAHMYVRTLDSPTLMEHCCIHGRIQENSPEDSRSTAISTRRRRGTPTRLAKQNASPLVGGPRDEFVLAQVTGYRGFASTRRPWARKARTNSDRNVGYAGTTLDVWRPEWFCGDKEHLESWVRYMRRHECKLYDQFGCLCAKSVGATHICRPSARSVENVGIL
ncbi:uncharacterized protein EV422DRAFT_202126 [Fimicolochytrium jonesii]|uniref:uncharacterized protein n=1 Tax=Fimicolochytrium jonesii TaxID=1396493 RepID=UPI0022FF0604|nr:uncharacterized protein EV422DRAFT_202126 [Fimicolochytrium jonesii]KAI8818003.1 hypothetical protein EV422DRAFT_202126 [Fimicolochytrium jonesii]